MDDFTRNIVAAIQHRLSEMGYYALKIDGDPGAGTRNAVIRFKANNGLRARDYIGPKTMAALYSAQAKPAPVPVARAGEPPWLTEARALIGVKELAGPANNAQIMQWADDLDQWYPGDDVPWCGLFVAHCMDKGAPGEPQNFNRLGARQWMQYGMPADEAIPPLGAVIPMWRTHKTRSVNGHVAIVTGYNATHVRGIGGNQSDQVSELWFPRDRILGVRVPVGYRGAPAPYAVTGQLSTREA